MKTREQYDLYDLKEHWFQALCVLTHVWFISKLQLLASGSYFKIVLIHGILSYSSFVKDYR